MDFFLMNTIHRDLCFISAIIMFCFVFIRSESIEWQAFLSVTGFFSLMVLTLRGDVFRYMSTRYFEAESLMKLKNNVLPHLTKNQKRALLSAEMESVTISLSALVFE
jgi:hypothetical protein